MKKSSTRSSSVGNGQIDSALSTACEENEARVTATLFGDVGDGKDAGPDVLASSPGDCSICLLLMASACLFGGPRLLLGLVKVQPISKAAQARHGGPDSSH